jgi:manganese efflux pump family protein
VRKITGLVWSALLAALLTAGCSVPAPAANRATVNTCYAFGLRALQRHITVAARPAACAGLTDQQINAAAARAVGAAVGAAPKTVARRLSVRDRVYLERLLRGAGPPRPAPAAGAPARPSTGLPLRLAALAAWLSTAAAGAYLLAGWLAASGARRRRRPGGLVFSHFALAVAGLGVWIAFSATGLHVLGWLAVGLIILIAGLGMGALTAALSQQSPGPAPAQGTASTLGPAPAQGTAPTRARTPVAVIAVHGVLATTTILLVLLATIGAA